LHPNFCMETSFIFLFGIWRSLEMSGVAAKNFRNRIARARTRQNNSQQKSCLTPWRVGVLAVPYFSVSNPAETTLSTSDWTHLFSYCLFVFVHTLIANLYNTGLPPQLATHKIHFRHIHKLSINSFWQCVFTIIIIIHYSYAFIC
jgi:hypothetical protein